MKLVTFTADAIGDRLGVLGPDGSSVVDLAAATDDAVTPFGSMLALIEAGDDALDHARAVAAKATGAAVLPVETVTLRTPLPTPPQIRDCLCFEAHLKRAYDVLRKNRAAAEPDPEAALKEFEEKGLFRIPEVWYEQPIYYKANRFTVIGTDEDVLWPDYADILDYELEFGFFVKNAGKNIPREAARDHIFGYAIFNDISARDAQAIEMPGQLGPGKGKDFDTGNVIGPCIVTADEIDPYDLVMTARVNGEEWSRGHSGNHALEIRGPDRPHLALGDPLPGRVLRLGHGRRAAAVWSWSAISRPATWSSWRSRASACCATGSSSREGASPDCHPGQGAAAPQIRDPWCHHARVQNGSRICAASPLVRDDIWGLNRRHTQEPRRRNQ